MTPTNERHEIARMAAQTAAVVAQSRAGTTPAQAAAAVTKAYRTAIATLAKTITLKE